MRHFILAGIFLLAVYSAGCATADPGVVIGNGPIDPNATQETQALLRNLDQIRFNHVLFGHQDDLAYGVHWVNQPGRSDVKEVAGSYPAVYGWELGDLELGAEQNLDGVTFRNMQQWIREGHSRGGVITIGWHMNNPESGGNAWDTTRAIHTILPGGAHHETFLGWLDRFATFNQALTDEAGRPIPVLFRPYHEMTGSWFWWGGDNVTPEEYVQLWQMTVDYLRDEKGLNNLIYVYSTDRFDAREEFLAHYPGDEYVDVLGLDDYHAWRQPNSVELISTRLRMLVEIAEERGKVPVLSETGYERIPDETWWTEELLAGITADPVGSRIAYVLVWRNANAEHDRPDHYYAPYPGHPSADNFVRFREDPVTLFEDDLPNLYRFPDAAP